MKERIRIARDKERKLIKDTREDNYKMLAVLFYPIWVPLLALICWLIFK